MKRGKVSKTLGNFQSPYILSLARLIETQSKATLIRWSTDYAEKHILPVYESAYPLDTRPRDALRNAVGWLEGRVRFVDAKETNNGAHTAATEAEGNHAAQAAARACAHAALSIHVSAHSLGIAFYGAAAIAYAQVGIAQPLEVYEKIAEHECEKMEAALRDIAVRDEPAPARLNWEFWAHVIRP